VIIRVGDVVSDAVYSDAGSAGGTLAFAPGSSGWAAAVHQFGGWSYFYAVAVLGTFLVDPV